MVAAEGCRRSLGLPADFATKKQLIRTMIERAVTAQVLFAWATGDQVYGDNGPLRAWLGDEHLV